MTSSHPLFPLSFSPSLHLLPFLVPRHRSIPALFDMKIATLQFAPRLGEVEANMQRADELLEEAEREGKLDGVWLIVGPEMGMTGES